MSCPAVVVTPCRHNEPPHRDNLVELSAHAWGVQMTRAAYGAATHQDWTEDVLNRALREIVIVANCVGNRVDSEGKLACRLREAFVELSRSMMHHVVVLLRTATTDHWTCALALDKLREATKVLDVELPLDQLSRLWADFTRHLIESDLSAEALLVDPRYTHLQAHFTYAASELGCALGGSAAQSSGGAAACVGASMAPGGASGVVYRREIPPSYRKPADYTHAFGIDVRELPLITFGYRGFDGIFVTQQQSFSEIFFTQNALATEIDSLRAKKEEPTLIQQRTFVDQARNFGRLLFHALVRPHVSDTPSEENRRRLKMVEQLNKLDNQLVRFAQSLLASDPGTSADAFKVMFEIYGALMPAQIVGGLAETYHTLFAQTSLAPDRFIEIVQQKVGPVDDWIVSKIDLDPWIPFTLGLIDGAVPETVDGKIGGPKMNTQRWQAVAALINKAKTFGGKDATKRTFFFPSDEAIAAMIGGERARGTEFLNYLVDNPGGVGQQKFFSWLVKICSWSGRLLPPSSSSDGTASADEGGRSVTLSGDKVIVADRAYVPAALLEAKVIEADKGSASRPVIHVVDRVLDMAPLDWLRLKREDIHNYSIALRWLVNTATITSFSNTVLIPDNQIVRKMVDPKLFEQLNTSDQMRPRLLAREFFFGHFLVPNLDEDLLQGWKTAREPFHNLFDVQMLSDKKIAVREHGDNTTAFSFTIDQKLLFVDEGARALMQSVLGVKRYNGPALLLGDHQMHPLAAVTKTSKLRTSIIAHMVFVAPAAQAPPQTESFLGDFRRQVGALSDHYKIGMVALNSAKISPNNSVVLLEDGFWHTLFADQRLAFDNFVNKMATDPKLARRFLSLFQTSGRQTLIESLATTLSVRQTPSGVMTAILQDPTMFAMRSTLVIMRRRLDLFTLIPLTKDNKTMPVIWGAEVVETPTALKVDRIEKRLRNGDEGRMRVQLIKDALFPVPSATVEPKATEQPLFEKILRFSDLRDPDTGLSVADSPNYTLLVPPDRLARVELDERKRDSLKKPWGVFVADPNVFKLADDQVAQLLTSKAAARRFINAHLIPRRITASTASQEGYRYVAEPSLQGKVFGQAFKVMRSRQEGEGAPSLIFMGDNAKEPFKFLGAMWSKGSDVEIAYIPIVQMNASDLKTRPVVHYISSWLVKTDSFLDDGKSDLPTKTEPAVNRARAAIKRVLRGGRSDAPLIADVVDFSQSLERVMSSTVSPASTVFLLHDQLEKPLQLIMPGRHLCLDQVSPSATTSFYRHPASKEMMMSVRSGTDTFDFQIVNDGAPLWKTPVAGMPVVYGIHPLNTEECAPFIESHECWPEACSLNNSALIGLDLIERSCLLKGPGICAGRFMTLILPNDECWVADEKEVNHLLSHPEELAARMKHFVFGSDSRSLARQDLIDLSKTDSCTLTALDGESVLLSSNAEILYLRKSGESHQHKIVASSTLPGGIHVHVVCSMF